MSYLGNSPTQQIFASSAEQFNGDNSNTDFTLSRTIYSTNDIEVLVENVQQDPFSAYTVSGTTLSFTEAPPTGTGNIVVTYRNYTISKFVPEEGTVGSTTLQANSVTSAAIANGQVKANNLADTAVTSGVYGNNSIIPVITVDAQGRLTNVVNTSISTNIARYDDATANFTGTLQNNGSNVTTANNTQTLTNKTITDIIHDGSITEEIYTLGTSGSLALNPANGTIQTCGLTSDPTFTDSLSTGQSMVLMLANGSSYSVTWPSTTWVTSAGNSAPTLTAADTLVFWKISTILYGAYVGSYV